MSETRSHQTVAPADEIGESDERATSELSGSQVAPRSLTGRKKLSGDVSGREGAEMSPETVSEFDALAGLLMAAVFDPEPGTEKMRLALNAIFEAENRQRQEESDDLQTETH